MCNHSIIELSQSLSFFSCLYQQTGWLSLKSSDLSLFSSILFRAGSIVVVQYLLDELNEAYICFSGILLLFTRHKNTQKLQKNGKVPLYVVLLYILTLFFGWWVEVCLDLCSLVLSPSPSSAMQRHRCTHILIYIHKHTKTCILLRKDEII